MDVVSYTAAVAKLIGEPARAQMLVALMGGCAMTATELATSANISPQTTSSHLAQLVEGNLLTLEKQGRHRYYRLASPEVAGALEGLMLLAPVKKEARSKAQKPIYFARSCYDHVAGRVGVALADALVDKGWLIASGKDFSVTKRGEQAFKDFGLDLDLLEKERRHFARQCLDWTERRHHVAGALGAALMAELLGRKWLKKDRTGRILYVSSKGYEGLEETFGVRLQQV